MISPWVHQPVFAENPRLSWKAPSLRPPVFIMPKPGFVGRCWQSFSLKQKLKVLNNVEQFHFVVMLMFLSRSQLNK